MKIIHISDTHLKPFPELPKADILIHSGDGLNYGDIQNLIKFRQQLKDIRNNYNYIIYVPGNHDRIFEEDFNFAKDFLKEEIFNLIVMHNEEWIHPETGYKFYGTSDQPEFCNWAFNKPPHELIESYSHIPEDVNILITHCPAKGIRDVIYDESVGSPELALKVSQLKELKLHCFGHIHYSYGIEQRDGIYYSNAAICNEQYQPVNKEILIELDNPIKE